MRWNEVTRKLKKLRYKEGVRKTHYTIWNCPCPIEEGNHPVGIGNHLVPHLKDFGKT